MVPRDWTIGSLSDLADTVMGYAFKSTDFTPNGIPLLRMGNLYQNTLDFERNPVFLPATYKDEYKRFVVKPGDLVMSMTGTMGKRDYGFTVEIPKSAPESLLNQRVMKFVPKDKTSPGFLLNLLRSEIILSRLYSFPGGTKQANLSAKQVQDLPAPIPPLPEQKKIAKILSTWDKAITTTEQLLASSQQQKKALMQQLLTGKKRLRDKNGVRFSGEWSEYLIEELEKLGWVELGRGKVISKKDIENTPGDYPIYSSSVKNNGLMGMYGEYMFDEELISWSVDGGGNFFYRPKHKFSVTNVSGYMRLNTENLNYQFIAAQLELSHLKLKFDYQSKAHPSVIRKSYNLTIPSLEEQQKIAAVLSAADKEIEMLQKQLDQLKQEKKALMQQLLTGKRRVKIDNKEVT